MLSGLYVPSSVLCSLPVAAVIMGLLLHVVPFDTEEEDCEPRYGTDILLLIFLNGCLDSTCGIPSRCLPYRVSTTGCSKGLPRPLIGQ